MLTFAIISRISESVFSWFSKNENLAIKKRNRIAFLIQLTEGLIKEKNKRYWVFLTKLPLLSNPEFSNLFFPIPEFGIWDKKMKIRGKKNKKKTHTQKTKKTKRPYKRYMITQLPYRCFDSISL